MEQDLGVQRDRRRFEGERTESGFRDPWKREGQSLDDPIRKRLGFGEAVVKGRRAWDPEEWENTEATSGEGVRW